MHESDMLWVWRDVTGWKVRAADRRQNWTLFPRSDTADTQPSSSFSHWSHTRNCDITMLNRTQCWSGWTDGDVSAPLPLTIVGSRPVIVAPCIYYNFVDLSVLRGAPPLTCLNRVKLFICIYMYIMYKVHCFSWRMFIMFIKVFRFFNASANSLNFMIEVLSSGLCWF